MRTLLFVLQIPTTKNLNAPSQDPCPGVLKTLKLRYAYVSSPATRTRAEDIREVWVDESETQAGTLSRELHLSTPHKQPLVFIRSAFYGSLAAGLHGSNRGAFDLTEYIRGMVDQARLGMVVRGCIHNAQTRSYAGIHTQ